MIFLHAENKPLSSLARAFPSKPRGERRISVCTTALFLRDALLRQRVKQQQTMFLAWQHPAGSTHWFDSAGLITHPAVHDSSVCSLLLRIMPLGGHVGSSSVTLICCATWVNIFSCEEGASTIDWSCVCPLEPWIPPVSCTDHETEEYQSGTCTPDTNFMSWPVVSTDYPFTNMWARYKKHFLDLDSFHTSV